MFEEEFLVHNARPMVDPTTGGEGLEPLADRVQFERVSSYIEQARREGARVQGGEKIGDRVRIISFRPFSRLGTGRLRGGGCLTGRSEADAAVALKRRAISSPPRSSATSPRTPHSSARRSSAQWCSSKHSPQKPRPSR